MVGTPGNDTLLGGSGAENIESFESSPWPKWIYKFAGGTRIQQEIFVVDEAPVTCVAWKLLSVGGPVKLTVRPFLSGRDYHGLHRSNTAFRFDAAIGAGKRLCGPFAWRDRPDFTCFQNASETAAIGRGVAVPTASVSASDAAERFAFLGAFVGVDNPTSSEVTRKVLGWEPAYPGLLDDLEHGHYFSQG